MKTKNKDKTIRKLKKPSKKVLAALKPYIHLDQSKLFVKLSS